jgi:hypothetical protein
LVLFPPAVETAPAIDPFAAVAAVSSFRFAILRQFTVPF